MMFYLIGNLLVLLGRLEYMGFVICVKNYNIFMVIKDDLIIMRGLRNKNKMYVF